MKKPIGLLSGFLVGAGLFYDPEQGVLAQSKKPRTFIKVNF